MQSKPTLAVAVGMSSLVLALAGCGSDRSSTRSTEPTARTSTTANAPDSKPARIVVMPDLVGLGVYEAQCKLEDLGVGWSADGRKPTKKPETDCETLKTAVPVPDPAIIAQKPKPGTKMLRGGTIGLVTKCANQRAPENGPYCIR